MLVVAVETRHAALTSRQHFSIHNFQFLIDKIMSEILSYSNQTSQGSSEDWIPVEPYQDDDIARIKDPDGGLSRNPRTAIPSPFAQLDLVKNAFAQLANPNLRGAAMNERLVSNALDVMQLLFDFENHKDYLRIVRWNRDEQLELLKNNPSHRLYGETLGLFLSTDMVYNFDQLHDWYILMYDNQVLGGTSPASLVMAAPVSGPVEAIKVDEEEEYEEEEVYEDDDIEATKVINTADLRLGE